MTSREDNGYGMEWTLVGGDEMENTFCWRMRFLREKTTPLEVVDAVSRHSRGTNYLLTNLDLQHFLRLL